MRKSPLKSRSKTPKAKLIQQADRLWSIVVKRRANGLCEWCSKPASDAHHMVCRRRSAYLRHALENGVALCQGCHHRFHNHESLSGWRKFEAQRPSDFLHVDANKCEIWKLGLTHYREVIEFLEKEASE